MNPEDCRREGGMKWCKKDYPDADCTDCVFNAPSPQEECNHSELVHLEDDIISDRYLCRSCHEAFRVSKLKTEEEKV